MNLFNREATIRFYASGSGTERGRAVVGETG